MAIGGENGSPKRAARGAAATVMPPTKDTGCGRVHGFGVTLTSVPR